MIPLSLIVGGVAALLVVILFFRMLKIVPEQEAWIVEQFGKYKKTLGAGLHTVIPVLQRVAYRHTLKEEAIDVTPQVCITSDNVQVTVDGILYLRVADPFKASYGIENYRYATVQLAQTTMRSEIGKINLDDSFFERDKINTNVVKCVDDASDNWGIKVTRYEIRDIAPTAAIQDAMEQQMRAEREKRASILQSDGEKLSRINVSKGEMEEAINLSKGEKQKKINESEGKAKAIELLAGATAEGVKEVAEAISTPGGKDALSMRIAQQYLAQFGNILEHSTTSVLPLEAAQIKALLGAVLPGAQKGEPIELPGIQIRGERIAVKPEGGQR